MTNCLKKYLCEGAFVTNMKDKSVFHDVRHLIDDRFTDTDEHYSQLDREEFSKIAVNVQTEMNSLDVQRRFVSSEKDLISKLLRTDNICLQSVCFLRAVRPEALTGIVEAPDFHRETFYSDDAETTRNMLNIWIPIKNVSSSNSIKYIPASHKIPDETLSLSYADDLTSVEKFSSAHKLGFFWAQKKLNGGCEKQAVAAPFSGSVGEYLGFSSMTIHGGGRNPTPQIRFAVGFGLIAENKIRSNPDYFASGKKYWVRF